MADDTTNNETAETTEGSEPEEQIMCYISKQMVPISETVEVNYGNNKKYRVLPRYIKY